MDEKCSLNVLGRRSMRFCRQGIGGGGCAALAKALRENDTLEALCIEQDETVGCAGARALRAGLREAHALRRLTMVQCSLGGEGAALIAESLPSQIEEVDLGANAVGDEGAAAVARSLLNRHRVSSVALRVLALRACAIGDPGASHIAEIAAVIPSLVRIDLRDNRIGKEGARLLASSLASCGCSLTHMLLDGNELRCEGAMALAVALQNDCCTLQTLWLCGNGIGDAGASALASAIAEQRTRLRWLKLSRNCIGETGGEHVLAALEVNDSVVIDVDQNCMSKVLHVQCVILSHFESLGVHAHCRRSLVRAVPRALLEHCATDAEVNGRFPVLHRHEPVLASLRELAARERQ